MPCRGYTGLELVSEWAPGLEDVAADLHQRLGWDREVGSHHDWSAVEVVVQRADARQLGHRTQEPWHQEAEGERHAAAFYVSKWRLQLQAR